MKELILVYNGPMKHKHVKTQYVFRYFEKFFDKVHVIYWSHESYIGDHLKGKLTLHPIVLERFCPATYMFLAFCELLRTLRRQRCVKVVLYSMPLWAGIPSLIAAKLFQRPILIRVPSEMVAYMRVEGRLSGSSDNVLKIKSLLLEGVLRLILRIPNHVIAISRALEREARRLNARNVEYIPLPLDTSKFKPLGDAKGKGKKTILYVGTIKRVKGVDLLLEAFRLLTERNPDFPLKLLIVGYAARSQDLVFLKSLKEKADLYGVNAKFTGYIPNELLPEVYGRANVFVLPSWSEGLGASLMEAMACGLPCIGTRVGGIMDLIEHGRNGFLVDPGDVDCLVRCLEVILHGEDLGRTLGRRGRDRILEILREIDYKYSLLFQDVCAK